MGFNNAQWSPGRAQKSIYKVDRRQMSLELSEEEALFGHRVWPLYRTTWILVEQRKDYMKFEYSSVPDKPTWILELQRKQ